MRELTVLRNARPEVPAAIDGVRDAARSRLLMLIDADLDGVADGHLVVGDRGAYGRPTSTNGRQLLPPTGVGDELGPIARRLPRRWVAAVATVLVALGVVFLDLLAGPVVETPVIEDAPGPVAPTTAPLGTLDAVTTDSSRWSDGTVSP